MAEVKLEKTPCDRELIEKILAILEKHEIAAVFVRQT